MTAIGFYIWGHMKSLVFETPVNTEELVTQSIVMFDDILERPQLCRMKNSVVDYIPLYTTCISIMVVVTLNYYFEA